MKIAVFSKRNAQEILRDPVNLFFGLGFPLVLLFLFSIINNAIPAEANIMRKFCRICGLFLLMRLFFMCWQFWCLSIK